MKIRLVLVLGVLLAFGFCLIGCDTDGTSSNTETVDTGDDTGTSGDDTGDDTGTSGDNTDGDTGTSGDNSGGSSERDPALIGSWKGPWYTITFSTNGSYSNGAIPGFDMTWTTSGGVISLDFAGRNEPNTASYSVSGNRLTITNSNTGFCEDDVYTR
jgi:hypothetical protein